MRDQRIDQRAALGAKRPYADGLVEAARRHVLARRIESDRVQAVLWLAQRIEPRAGRDVPDLHGTVRGARYQSLAVGCESQCVNRVDVVLKRADLFSGIHVPELDQFVIARSGHAFSVR